MQDNDIKPLVCAEVSSPSECPLRTPLCLLTLRHGRWQSCHFLSCHKLSKLPWEAGSKHCKEKRYKMLSSCIHKTSKIIITAKTKTQQKRMQLLSTMWSYQRGVSLKFRELSKKFFQTMCIAEIVLLMRISSLNLVHVPKTMLWAHVQSFSLKFSP